MMQDTDRLWQAVQTRDAGRDGDFVYAVRTTGIFCRPSCPSRPKRRENVAFFPTAQEAAAHGFRPCLRCRPEAPPHDAAHAVVAAACARLDTAEAEPDLAALAAQAGYSRWHFLRLFRSHVGLTPKQYAMARRKERLRATLPKADSVTQAIYAAGFGASSRAYADTGALGMAPATLRKGAAGEVIRYAQTQASLGPVTVAASERGVCLIEFGTLDEILPRMAARFPKAVLEPAGPDLAALIDRVAALVERPGGDAQGLSLDIRGTVFQERVWSAMASIPAGETLSYAELAERIGAPGSARAVARACAGNCLAVAIPCHRVVRGDGALSGYRWGVERKRALIERERAEAAAAVRRGPADAYRPAPSAGGATGDAPSRPGRSG
ncbi:bifunctional DNA-binding transcriptional regulator/O6-methylguanine-DNA methyltransferase Ada [Aureimonas frigidaquae]|uniref:methylated-DNA--[protein]-cysteine S-methyltransferase n=1 Tax=Aureimonas frigidaquae TaxID=424757 RepID=A0A0P0Z023_9HYPH|nr:bifunctional DNA-binding transcriptional regulator/O6-methylguanine-DNA methyltransferase Ada [Aureimonas frigidaquae]BAT27278.1 methylated-DNA-protein-cysteine methyltransferase [Aureimonas frigidaquae]